MIGERYWSTGITVQYWKEWPAWSGRADFYDSGFADDSVPEGRISTEGTLRTRYVVRSDDSVATLSVVIDTLIRDADRLGIHWEYKHLYYPSDGESTEFPPPPNWRELLAEQCRRIGWDDAYAPLEATTI